MSALVGLARFRNAEGRAFRALDPVLRWLALDGVGFHDGYFGSVKGHKRDDRRRRPSLYGARMFDQVWAEAFGSPQTRPSSNR
jgi:hypothetical protein